MNQYLQIHPDNPQQRLVRQAVDIVEGGGVIVYPTDSSYAVGCAIGAKPAMERIRRLRRMPKDHDFTLVCRDLSEISAYARVDNAAYRLLKSLTPGPYTFILRATSEVPKRLQDPKRRSVGIRIPDNPIAQALVEELGMPLMSSTLQFPDEALPVSKVEDIRGVLETLVDAVVDGGTCGIEPTTVLDMSQGGIEVIRQGKGDASAFI